MIDDEFYSIAGRALSENRFAKTIQIERISPTGLGPMIEWTSSRALDVKTQDNDGFYHPRASTVLNILARTLALRWSTGMPLCPVDWAMRLHRGYPDLVSGLPAVGPGWSWLLAGAADYLTQFSGGVKITTHEIKEKYGTLRWQISTSEFSSDIEEHIDCVDFLSGFICEKCGAPGEIIEIRGWMRSRCLKCTGAAI
ncbi:hypothetical protein [Methylobacterium indicum]|uniref:Uncharacterized protein n=1 Tax=Methylobacterium indicum TaxID=1775910 RepID=A0A8H8WSM6_9HYPH|nr:hypothetical protein [Methylobacterium indicum]BCM83723.1 hypothetical protein mvi_21840 [Methylobacterium indicum]